MYPYMFMPNMFIVMLVLLWLVCWILCVIIGSNKGTGCLSAIVGLLGPLGLIVVLIDHGNRIKCPYCREYIDMKATVCPRCHSQVNLTPQYIYNKNNANEKRQGNSPLAYDYNKGQSYNSKNIETGGANNHESTNVQDINKHALSRINVGKYADIDPSILAQIRKAVEDCIFIGTEPRKSLKAILQKADTAQKNKILLYADTMRSDFSQAVQDYIAENEGELYWEYTGPEDDRMRDVCIDLMAIRYFTNSQRKQAEKETALERMYGCRHIFQQITKYDFEHERKQQSIDYSTIVNKERVERILIS